jgi:RNA ligase partner protein
MAERPLKQRFVLHTSLFLTDGIREGDESLAETLSRFLNLLAEAKLELHVSCYISPSVFQEPATMLADRSVPDETVSKLSTWLGKKHPDCYGVSVSADVVYEHIEEMTGRVDHGLRVAERTVREAGTSAGGDETDGSMSAVDRVVSDLRDE